MLHMLGRPKGSSRSMKASNNYHQHLKLSPLVTLLFVLVTTAIKTRSVLGYETCPNTIDFCPDGNTCCPMKKPRSATIRYGCVPNDMGSYKATCCDDGETACPVNYSCRLGDDGSGSCQANEHVEDPLVQSLPRYTLGRPGKAITKVHGLPVSNKSDDPTAKLAYYSSHGDITLGSSTITTAAILVHGAGRNADDYFCVAKAILSKTQLDKTKVLLVAPQFLEFIDGPIMLEEGGYAMRWNQTDGSTGSSSGPWRHGANSAYPFENGPSSFDALDAMISTLLDKSRYPKMSRVTIAGHSSGGQTVQRWSMLTSIDWDHARLYAVVANPSSFAYFTPLRKLHGIWQIPPDSSTCSDYDRWQWGFEDGGDMPIEYKERAFDEVGRNVTNLIDRFAQRSVTYLAGGADRCNISYYDHDSWCYSHGLETSCMDEMQGPTRWDRNLHYIEMLRLIGIPAVNHTRRVVPSVGHDHSLMFGSDEGLVAIFGNDWGPLMRTKSTKKDNSAAVKPALRDTTMSDITRAYPLVRGLVNIPIPAGRP